MIDVGAVHHAVTVEVDIELHVHVAHVQIDLSQNRTGKPQEEGLDFLAKSHMLIVESEK